MSWQKIGDAASDVAKRAEFEKLARELRTVCDKAIEGGAPPTTLIGALAMMISHIVCMTNDACEHAIRETLYDMVENIMDDAIAARRAVEAKQ